MLVIKNLFVQKSTQLILKDLSFSLTSTGIYSLLGLNGSGKSTLLKTLAHLNNYQGSIEWQNSSLNTYSRQKLSSLLTYLSPNPLCLFPFTVEEFIKMGTFSHKQKDSIEKAIDALELKKYKNKLLINLSTGEKQKVYLARALATKATIFLLDEPTNALDYAQKKLFWHLMRQVAEKGSLILIATHDLLAAKHYSDGLLLLHKQILYQEKEQINSFLKEAFFEK